MEIGNRIRINRIDCVSLTHFCYFLFIGLLVGCKAFGFSTTGSVANSIPYIVCAGAGTLLLVFKMALEHYSKREFLLSLFILCVALLTFLFSKEYGFLFFAFAVVGGGNINTFKVLKFACKIWVICYIVNMILILLKVKDNSPVPMYDSYGITGYAYVYGYGHKNQFSIATFTTFLSYIYLRKYKRNFLDVSIVFGVLFYLMTTCKSSTGLIILSLAYVLYLLLKFRVINNRNIKILRFVLPICVIGTILLTFIYRLGYGDFFNKLFSSRLTLQSIYFDYYPISIFGHDLSSFPYFIDNGYCALYFEYGIVAFIIFYWLYNKTIKALIKNNKKYELMMVTCFLLSGLMEGYFINPFMNISILLLSLVIYPNNKCLN